MTTTDPTGSATFPHWIGRHAVDYANRVAVTFISDEREEHSWTYEQLWRKACSVAERLPTVEEPDPRALLLFPPGIEFLAGFLGCQIAGWIPVPTCYPKAGREMPRLDSAARDCKPSALVCDTLTDQGIDPARLCPEARDLPRIQTDPVNPSDSSWVNPDSLELSGDALALLQYTSGSTNEPKGVMVRQSNLMANLEAIRQGFGIEWQEGERDQVDTGVFWLPFFHDMGLIGGILEPLYVGGRSVLMSPRSFLQRPIRWLKGISDFRAVISGAPNFAYQLCVDRISPEHTNGLDLSHWRIAFSGAEPVRARTLHDFSNRFSSCGFNDSAFYPCYGLAEASLMAAGGKGPSKPKILYVHRESLSEGKPNIISENIGSDAQSLVGCGQQARQTDLRIVDPENSKPLDERKVGEIWLRGTSIALGYWNRPDENALRFDASLNDGTSGFFRTGDLGFIHDGELYVTGRLKDVIIIRGRNLFPQDIEETVLEAMGSEAGQCAAMSVESSRNEALAIVAELPRHVDEATLPDLARAIRRAVIEVHEVDPRHVLLVRPATVPRTSSGKVQRSRCRDMFDKDEIRTKYRYDRSSAGEQSPIPMPNLPSEPTPNDRQSMISEVEAWMTVWLTARAGVDPSEVDLEKPFADYGLDSMTAVEMSGEIEDWSGIALTPVIAWNHPTVARLSEFLVDELTGTQADAAEAENEEELHALLDEIEQLSDEDL
ncbi:MAG: AMP-binding protein [Planctomycetota bacterium]